MKEVLNANYMVCSECCMVAFYDDFFGLSFSEERKKEIEKIISGIEGLITAGDIELDVHSDKPCDCCKSQKPGIRYHCVLISNKREE